MTGAILGYRQWRNSPLLAHSGHGQVALVFALLRWLAQQDLLPPNARHSG